jgi:hypothetical protein
MGQQHVGTKLGPANGTLWHEKPCRWKSAKAGTRPVCHEPINSAFWPWEETPIMTGNRAYSTI